MALDQISREKETARRHTEVCDKKDPLEKKVCEEMTFRSTKSGDSSPLCCFRPLAL